MDCGQFVDRIHCCAMLYSAKSAVIDSNINKFLLLINRELCKEGLDIHVTERYILAPGDRSNQEYIITILFMRMFCSYKKLYLKD